MKWKTKKWETVGSYYMYKPITAVLLMIVFKEYKDFVICIYLFIKQLNTTLS